MSHRAQRVGDQVRAELSELLLREIKDPRIGFVTITAVTMSPDLRSARVYFSVLGSEAQQQSSLEALKAARGYLRRHVGQNLGLRFAPEIQFVLDHSIEQGSRIEQLLSEIAGARDENAGDELADAEGEAPRGGSASEAGAGTGERGDDTDAEAGGK